jgi:hypothetical protein
VYAAKERSLICAGRDTGALRLVQVPAGMEIVQGNTDTKACEITACRTSVINCLIRRSVHFFSMNLLSAPLFYVILSNFTQYGLMQNYLCSCKISQLINILVG